VVALPATDVDRSMQKLLRVGRKIVIRTGDRCGSHLTGSKVGQMFFAGNRRESARRTLAPPSAVSAPLDSGNRAPPRAVATNDGGR
jgi:hypothetical protein